MQDRSEADSLTVGARNWDLDRLYVCPNHDVVADDGAVKTILYENEPFHGEPTQVFAYLGIPDSGDREVPQAGHAVAWY